MSSKTPAAPTTTSSTDVAWLQTLGSVGTTAQAYLRVPIGVALGVLFLGESLTPMAWLGMASSPAWPR